MKYIILTIALVLVLVSLPQIADSQEIDFDQLYQSLHDMQTTIGTISQLAIVAKEGKVTVVGVGDIVFTPEQRQSLVQQYLVLKAELAILYQQLP